MGGSSPSLARGKILGLGMTSLIGWGEILVVGHDILFMVLFVHHSNMGGALLRGTPAVGDCLSVSGTLLGSAPQRGVQVAQQDGHDGKQDEARQDDDGPVWVLQSHLGRLRRTDKGHHHLNITDPVVSYDHKTMDGFLLQ